MPIKLLLFLCLSLPAFVSAADIGIQWDANSEPDLACYTVYLKTVQSDLQPDPAAKFLPVGRTTAIRYTFAELAAGKKYRAAVTARNISGLESLQLSNVVEFSLPAAPAGVVLVVD